MLLLIFNIAVSWGLFILIWLVQMIIYPGFHRIPSADFINYHRWYVIRISAIVLPLMLCEVIITTGWLVFEGYTYFSVGSGLLVAFIWLSTFLLQVPVHNQLQSGKDEAKIRRLVTTNWIRTIAWSVKTAVVTTAAVSGFH
jgi:hypothetical protein